MNFYMFDRERERRERLALLFQSEYGHAPGLWFSSPGRAEIIGGQTDHNFGKALASALSCDILCAAEKRNDGIIELRSDEFLPIRFSVYDLGNREREKAKTIALSRGVLDYLQRNGYSFGGFSACTHNNLFRGAGISSSAAFAILIAEIVNVLYLDGKLPPLEKAKAGKYAENVYFGNPCSFLDQAGAAFGGFYHIDLGLKDPALTRVPIPKGYRIVLVNAVDRASQTRLSAEIRRDMGEVSSFYSRSTLRDVSFEEFEENLPRLRKSVSDRAILRTYYYFEENDRVDRAAQALLDGNPQAFLRQIQRSGESGLSYLQGSSAGEVSQPLTLAMKLSERYLKDGAFRMMGGTGMLLAFVKEGQEREYFRVMSRIFGRENVFVGDLRERGTCEIKV